MEIRQPSKFVKHEIPTLEQLEGSHVLILWHHALDGKLTKEEKQDIFERVVVCDWKYGIKYQGWFFDFKPWLKKYWVKTMWGGIREYYAFSKTQLRDYIKFEGKILKIIELAS